MPAPSFDQLLALVEALPGDFKVVKRNGKSKLVRDHGAPPPAIPTTEPANGLGALILATVRDAGRPLKITQMAELAGKRPTDHFRRQVYRLVENNLLSRLSEDFYELHTENR